LRIFENPQKKGMLWAGSVSCPEREKERRREGKEGEGRKGDERRKEKEKRE